VIRRKSLFDGHFPHGMGLALVPASPLQSNEVSMKAKLLVAVIALVVPQALRAQVVSAEIVIHQGPVAARVAVNPYYYPRYHVARVIVVERNHGQHRGWYKPRTGLSPGMTERRPVLRSLRRPASGLRGVCL
jgi:hypothetical protein